MESSTITTQGHDDLIQAMADSLEISISDISVTLADTNGGLSIQYSIIGNYNTHLQTADFETILVSNMGEYESLDQIVNTFSTPSSYRNNLSIFSLSQFCIICFLTI